MCEPHFDSPWRVREACIQSLVLGRTSYTSYYGLQELRDAISAYLFNQEKLEYTPDDQILITVGVSEAMDLVMRALLNPGEEVICPEPCYV